jgi:hypothetical protein
MGPKANVFPSAVKDMYMTFKYQSFMFYAHFLINYSVCSVKVTTCIYQGTVQSQYQDTYTAGLPSHVFLPSALERQSTECDITKDNKN